MHIYIGNLTIIGSDNASLHGLPPQTNVWIHDGMLLIGPLGVNFSEICIEIQTFSYKKKLLRVLSAKQGPSCL